MIILLTCVHVIVCLVLILVILLQAGKGQGLSGSSFASGNVQSLLGTGAADFLTKATSICAICFLFTSIGLGYIESHKSRSLMNFSKRNAPIDVDAIKKALERVKKEDSVKNLPANTTQAAAGAKQTAADTSSTVAKTSASEISQVKAATSQATAEASQVKTKLPAGKS